MATHVARAKAIAEAIADKTLSAQLLADIGDAFAYTYRRGEALTNEQKATVFVNQMRKFAVEVVENWRITTAIETERQRVAPTAKPDLGTETPVNGT